MEDAGLVSGFKGLCLRLSWRTLNPQPWGRQVWVEVLPTTDLETQSPHVRLNRAFMGFHICLAEGDRSRYEPETLLASVPLRS